MVPVVRLPSLDPTLMHLPKPVQFVPYAVAGRTDRIAEISRPPQARPATLALEDAARWARENTPHDALLLCEDSRFRLRSRRSAAYGFKDGGIAYYLGKGPFMEWAHRAAAVNRAKESRDPAMWLDLGRQLGCDYVVLEKPALRPPLASEPVYQNGVFAIVRLR
jgi:hypothetical protein